MTTLLGGKYVLEQPLGGGGMAEVFLARTVGAEGFSRQVAIKRVQPNYSNNPQFASMFVSEARLSSRLQHPNVVSVLDFDRDADGCLFLVMELVAGADLNALMNTGLLPLPVVIFVITEVLRGLGYAHELPISADGVRGLVHRDVSPHNVLLSWEGAIKVSDFGIAKARAASDATATEMIKGKPAYMSPEQANGEPIDGRSDLFAVGVMLWEMLCGRTLFAGQTTHETLARLLFAPIPSPRSLRPEVPADLDRVVMRLLERERPKRYPNANSAIADLYTCADHPRNGRELLVATLEQRFADRAPARAQRLAESGVVTAADFGASAPVPSAGIPLPTPLDGISQPIAKPGGRRAMIGALGAVGVFVIACVVIVIATNSSSSSSARPTAAPILSPDASSVTSPPGSSDAAPATAAGSATVDSGSSGSASASPGSSGSAETAAQTTGGKNESRSTGKRRGKGSSAGKKEGSGIQEVNLGGGSN